MLQSLTVAWAEINSSELIVRSLVAIAIAALLLTIGYATLIQLHESVRSRGRMGAVARGGLDAKLSRKPKALVEFDDGFAAEREALKSELSQFYDATMIQARRKLGELTKRATNSVEALAESYGRHSVGVDGERHETRVAKYKAVCERQWSFFRSEMSYLSFDEVQDHLRHILESYKSLDLHCTRKDDAEVTPEALRSQEIVSLARAVIKRDVDALQEEMMEAIEPFADYYERHVKEWLSDRLFRVLGKLRQRGEKGATIEATDLKEGFQALRTRLEVIARLAERVGRNTQKMNQERLALGQLVFVGTVLSILAELKIWFPELAVGEPEGETPNATGENVVAGRSR